MKSFLLRAGLLGLAGCAMTTGVRAEIYSARDLDKDPMVEEYTLPAYPWDMKQGGTLGLVVVGGVVDENGKLTKAEVFAQSLPVFGAPGYECLRKWHFARGYKNGVPVSYYRQWPVVFTIPGAETYPESFLFGFPKKVTDGAADFRYTKAPEAEYNPPPVYPQEMWLAGKTGKAVVTYAVDTNGRVVNTQIAEASQPAFGLALAAAMERWRFKPATYKNKPAMALGRMTFEYDLYLPPDAAEIRLRKFLQEGGKFTPAKALDAPLNPVHQEGPRYPLALREKPEAGTATIEFIIDQDGWVRLPRIVSATRDEFGWAAVSAVRTWQFDAPRKDGKPVDVRIRVPLDFGKP